MPLLTGSTGSLVCTCHLALCQSPAPCCDTDTAALDSLLQCQCGAVSVGAVLAAGAVSPAAGSSFGVLGLRNFAATASISSEVMAGCSFGLPGLWNSRSPSGEMYSPMSPSLVIAAVLCSQHAPVTLRHLSRCAEITDSCLVVCMIVVSPTPAAYADCASPLSKQ